ncbi:YkgJ family cysteine cluster protein [Campylobacter sp. P0109]|uniref:YkgJ family cysteine cluster protein n=1 Tax=Campylobacter sp. P0109 TaxID=1895606 RepID=UPI000A3324D7|nr:YkgJ family cysteine cluster protein [Campylobacter sp. P0109]
MNFPCSVCGACCRHISNIPELRSFDLGNGVCKELDPKSNKCKIYDNRPLVCRIDEMYSFFSAIWSKEKFYSINAKACNELQILENIDENCRIKEEF